MLPTRTTFTSVATLPCLATTTMESRVSCQLKNKRKKKSETNEVHLIKSFFNWCFITSIKKSHAVIRLILPKKTNFSEKTSVLPLFETRIRQTVENVD